jgi:protein-S-isoprenylcysteine O-methyltransferase Ste14
MFILWLTWFWMVSSDPYKMNLPSGARYTGLALFIAGVSLFVLSHTVFRPLTKGQETEELVTNGIYLKIRHPMYLGFIIWIIGLPMFMNAGFTLATSIVWILHILYWKYSEEKQMVKRYGHYRDYMKKTWF